MKSFPKEMSLAGVKHPGKIQAIQWCNCRGGQQHRVALINNRIVLLDHKLELELAMLDLGGETCECMKIYIDIRQQETKRVIPTFGPYLEKMLHKKRRRQYGKFPDKIQPLPRHLHRLIELLLRYKCTYPIDIPTAITASCTGGSPFARNGWLYRFEMGGEQHMTLQINIEKEWKKNVYNNGIAVVDDKLVLAKKSSNGLSGDISVVVMDFDPSHGSFGTRNTIITKAHGEWRFKYMESQVTHNNFHHKYKGLAR